MHEDMKWLFGLLIVFGAAWFISGSFNKPISQKPFIKPMSVNNGGEVYGTDVIHIGKNSSGTVGTSGTSQKLTSLQEITQGIKDAGIQANKIQAEIAKLQTTASASPLSGKLSIASVTRATSASGEYVTIKASSKNTSSVLITGLRLDSVPTGNNVAITKAVMLPFQNQINAEDPVYLAPGQTAYIITGRSPIGASFLLNKCTGYFNQNQKFIPALPSQCPAPKNEPLPVLGSKYSDACLDYINTIPVCKTIISPPLNLSPECQQFVSMQYNYTKCVERHKGDSDFYGKVWMIYLGRTDTLWKSKRELIHLVDQSGKIIDAITY